MIRLLEINLPLLRSLKPNYPLLVVVISSRFYSPLNTLGTWEWVQKPFTFRSYLRFTTSHIYCVVASLFPTPHAG
jgi:hypothetical protein